MELLQDRDQVELYLACQKLKDLDFFGKSDPYVKVFAQHLGQWQERGKTETRTDNLSPVFDKTVLVDYIFEQQQPIKFEVWDFDDHTKDDVIGVAETTVGAIMGARKQTLILELHNKGKKATGTIVIRGEKTGSSRNEIFWQWTGVKLMNTDGFFNKSDPFLRIFKIRAGDVLMVHHTEVIKNNLNPIWAPFRISDDKLCSSVHNRPFRVECWDNESTGKHQFIGFVDVTIDQIRGGQKEFVLTNPKHKHPGTLKLANFALEEKPGFIDYLKGGEQINFAVAIDFTGSNGIPTQPTSLHARNENNQYQKAITSVGQILLAYDYDQQIPVFGFGGKPHYPTMNYPQVSHCFPCTGDAQNQQVLGLQGILDVYWHALGNVELSGPTYFAPLITEAAKAAQANKIAEADVYTILLILTDGEIHDMDATIDTIVAAANLPISVVIVGVGHADFTKMEVLDGDKGLQDLKGNKSLRDFVQFVPFNKFGGDPGQLAKHVLAEIPEQLCQYKKLIGQKPRLPATH